jgi:D-amino-acid dehydrogenase
MTSIGKIGKIGKVVKEEVIVLGAGIVGVACALELQRLGFTVTLVDKSEPGTETSYGNGGVIARSSLIPLNNPGLPAALPKLLRNQSPQLRYNPWYVLRNLSWAVGFLKNTSSAAFTQTAQALDSLIKLSTLEHRRLLAAAAVGARLRDTGWLFLYRDATAFQSSKFARSVYDEYSVKYQSLMSAEIADIEPSLKPVFTHGLHILDALSVDNPGAVVKAYATLFIRNGGKFVQREVLQIERQSSGLWHLGDLNAKHVVVALGPWSKSFLKQLGVSIPMAFERGYHQHFIARDGAGLNRPIYDTAKGYILTPMEQGVRLTTGVELTDQFARRNEHQLQRAVQSAAEVFPLGPATKDPLWLGSRPTLPDSRPMIGPILGSIKSSIPPNLWAAFGHQHIGFSTSTGTAALLGALMRGNAPPIDPMPFRSDRF